MRKIKVPAFFTYLLVVTSVTIAGLLVIVYGIYKELADDRLLTLVGFWPRHPGLFWILDGTFFVLIGFWSLSRTRKSLMWDFKHWKEFNE